MDPTRRNEIAWMIARANSRTDTDVNSLLGNLVQAIGPHIPHIETIQGFLNRRSSSEKIKYISCGEIIDYIIEIMRNREEALRDENSI